MGSKTTKFRIPPKTLEELKNNVDVDFTSEEIQDWYKEFQMSKNSRDRGLTKSEFKDVYNKLFEGDGSDFAEHVFRTFDSDGNGTVDFKEFVVGLCVSGSEQAETQLKWAFHVYDIDGDGFITKEEMTYIITAIYKMTSSDFSTWTERPQDLTEKVFNAVDDNNDGKISWEEFLEGSKKVPIIVDLLQINPEADTET